MIRCIFCGQYDAYIKEKVNLTKEVQHIVYRCPRCRKEWEDDKSNDIDCT